MAAVILGVGAVVALLLLVFMLQATKLSDANHKLQAQEARNSDLTSQITQLQPFADLKRQVAERETLTAAALDGQVLWSGVLRDVSMVIPDKVWLTGMVGSLNTPVAATAPVAPPTPGATPSPGATPAAPTTPAVTGPALIGTIQFTGFADDLPSVAQWLSRLERVTGWANPWISTATAVDESGPSIQWTGSLDLSDQATVQGGKG
jgi:Tfp pilus assembly protein PilN